MITGKCDICGDEIKSAATQVRFNIHLGMHKRYKHGIKGKHADKDKASWERRKQKVRLSRPAPAPNVPPPLMEMPIKLAECPCCGARFRAVKQ